MPTLSSPAQMKSPRSGILQTQHSSFVLLLFFPQSNTMRRRLSLRSPRPDVNPRLSGITIRSQNIQRAMLYHANSTSEMKVTVQPTNVCLNTPGFIFHIAEVQEGSPEPAQLLVADSIHACCPVVAAEILHPQDRQKGEGRGKKRGQNLYQEAKAFPQIPSRYSLISHCHH